MTGTEDSAKRGGEGSSIESLRPEKNRRTDAPVNTKQFRKIIEFVIQDKVVLPIIIINAIIFIALDIKSDIVLTTGAWIHWVDYACVLFFVFELIIKVNLTSFKDYINDGWFNRLDFLIVFASFPVLLEPLLPELAANAEWAPIFRMARFWKLTRFLRSARLFQYLRQNNLKRFKAPGYLILAISFSNIIITFLNFSGSWKILYDQFYGPSLLFVFTWLLSRAYDLIHDTYIKAYFSKIDEGVEGTVESIIAGLAQIFIWAIGISLTIELAGYNSTSILAGLGLGGMAIALAAQDSIGNLIGGLLLYINKTFKIGDGIEINNMKGTVRRLGLRSVNIVDPMGTSIVLPNKIFMTMPFKNNTAQKFLSGNISLKLDINLPAAKLEKAIDLISEIAIQYEHIQNEYTLSFGDMSDYCHNIEFGYLLNKESLTRANPEQLNDVLITNAKKYLYVKIIDQFLLNDISFYSKTVQQHN